MKKIRTYDLIDINKKKGFPRVYRFNPFIRWFVIILSLLAIAYSVWYIFTSVHADTPTFQKIVPFIIIFLASNSLIRNLFSLNSILFKENQIVFRFIASRTVTIPWENIRKIALHSGKARAIRLSYSDDKDSNKELIFTMTFPNMLEIINSISEMCPNLQYDDFMKNVTLTDREREEAKKKERKE